MAKATITRVLLRDLPPLPEGAVKIRIFDDRLTGFIAEQRASGITYYMRYSDARRRDREIKLGRLGDVTVDQARKRAEQLKASVSLGADPLAELDKKRAVPLFADFVRERYLPHVQERLRSAGNIEAYLRKRIVPTLGRKALDEISQDDVATLRRSLIDEGLSPASVNRHLATVRSMFNLALRWQLFEGRNPAASPGMLRERHRDVYLDAAQTQALVRALDADRCQDSAAALALLAVTGARKSEVLRATWDLVDLGRGVLTVPRGGPRAASHATSHCHPTRRRSSTVNSRAGWWAIRSSSPAVFTLNVGWKTCVAPGRGRRSWRDCLWRCGFTICGIASPPLWPMRGFR